jgi:hypothetical protein
MDPGFLPFNWVETKRFWYSWEDQLNGLAVTSLQVSFARAPPNRPPGSSFSSSAGRYVIRADHICAWIANWVGKRNHKQFILFNFYGFWLGLSLLSFTVAETEPPLLSLKVTEIAILFLSLTMEGCCAFTMLAVFVQLLCDLLQNRTTIQRMRREKGTGAYTCGESMREVCGNDCCGWWLCPNRAFDRSLVIRDDGEHAST